MECPCNYGRQILQICRVSDSFVKNFRKTERKSDTPALTSRRVTRAFARRAREKDSRLFVLKEKETKGRRAA